MDKRKLLGHLLDARSKMSSGFIYMESGESERLSKGIAYRDFKAAEEEIRKATKLLVDSVQGG